MGLDEFGKHLLGPAVGSARKTLHHFGRTSLDLSWRKLAKSQDKFQGRQWSGLRSNLRRQSANNSTHSLVEIYRDIYLKFISLLGEVDSRTPSLHLQVLPHQPQNLNMHKLELKATLLSFSFNQTAAMITPNTVIR